MFGFERLLHRHTVSQVARWPEEDLITNPKQISQILHGLRDYTRNCQLEFPDYSRDCLLPMHLMSANGRRMAAVRSLLLREEAQQLQLHLADELALQRGEVITLVLCWQHRMFACNVVVHAQPAVNELTLSWPELLVKGGGREFFRARPHGEIQVEVVYGQHLLRGRLANLSEGGLALEVPPASGVTLQVGQHLATHQLQIGQLLLQLSAIHVCSVEHNPADGACRLGLELIGLNEASLGQMRKLLLNWQTGWSA